MKCSNCQFENPDAMNFCGNCGNPLAVKRPPEGYTPPFLKKELLKAPGSIEGERKMVSVLFADVAGFTGMSESLDPEDVHEIMDGCFDILGKEIHVAGGSINQYTGDGVMALFGAPIAYEDHISRACYAALRIQSRMKPYTARIERDYGVHFQLRIGLHAGKVVVGAIGMDLRLDYTAAGDTTNVAARLEAHAHPGGILVSERVRDAAKLFFRFRKAEDFTVKGKREAVPAYTLLGERKSVHLTRRDAYKPAPFVNRKDELSVMKGALKDVLEGKPRLVSVEGEAGAGKSRLLSTFHDSIINKDILFLKGHCRPYGEATALYPLAQALRSYFHLSEKDSFKTVQKKIKQRAKDKSLISGLEKIFNLLSRVIEERDLSESSFEGEKRALFKAAKDLMDSILSVRPLILAFEDMQWVDETTRDFLFYLLETKMTGPLLVICLGRTIHKNWCPAIPHHFISLGPISDKSSIKILNSVLGTDHLDPKISQKIVSKAGGNPLFLVGMAETLKRKELMVCDEYRCTLTLGVEDLEIPEDIREVLTARLDALPESGKKVAQLASIIGGEFSCNLLKYLLKDDVSLKQGLKLLEKEGIIEKISSDLGGKYIFRHQMMQEIAYHGLLRRNRRRYHRLAGEAAERMFKDNLSNQAGFLAYHYYHSQDWRKAFDYTLEAGHIARRSFACREALMCFDRALDILQRGGWEHAMEKTLQIYKWKGGMHFCLGQKEKSRSAFYKMYYEAMRLRDNEAEAEALFRLGWISFYLHHPRASQGFLHKAIQLSQEKDFDEVFLKAASFQGFVYSVLGKLKEARPLLIQALALSKDINSLEGRAWCLTYLIQYYNWTGEFNEALGMCEELWKLNQKIKSPFFHIVLHFRRGLIYGALGRLDEAREILESGLNHLEIGDKKFWRPRFLNTLGWVLCQAGKMEEALRLNEQALEEALPTHNPETIHNAEINVGENHLQMGDMDKAGEVLENAWEKVKGPGISYVRWRYKIRLLIALAEFYEKTGERKKALNFANNALKMAIEKGAKKHEARALYVKAKILHQTRPNMAFRLFEQALDLSNKIGTGILAKGIRREMENL